jgi:hypothetical protein
MTELASEQREFLDQLLANLAQAAPSPSSQLIQGRSAADVIVAVDPIAFLNELKRFFDGQTLLSREEFIQIAKRCQSP